MKLCVFGASSDQIDRRYLEAGEDLGRRMARRGHQLIFGGGATGMIGDPSMKSAERNLLDEETLDAVEDPYSMTDPAGTDR